MAEKALSDSRDARFQDVRIYDRTGELITEFALEGFFEAYDREFLNFEWSNLGNNLSIILKSSSEVSFWNPVSGIQKIDTGLKGLKCIAWSLDDEFWAGSSTKGNLIIYECNTSKKIPIFGKHSKEIVSMEWISNHRLITASMDNDIIISGSDGNTLNSFSLKYAPSHLKWQEKCGQLLCVLNKKSIILFNSVDLSSNFDISINSSHGSILKAEWRDDSSIIVGFTSGFIAVLSSSENSRDSDLFHYKMFKSSLNDLLVSNTMGKIISCGDNEIKLQELDNPQDICSTITLPNGSSLPQKIGLSDNGQFLSVLTKENAILTYNSKSETLSSHWDKRLAFMKSSNEVMVVDTSFTPPVSLIVPVTADPTLVSIGPQFAVTVNGNSATFYEITKAATITTDQLEYQYQSIEFDPSFRITGANAKKSYPDMIIKLKMNHEYVVVLLANGKALLHVLQDENGSFMEFPEIQNDLVVSDVFLSCKFFIYALSDGRIVFFDLNELQTTQEFKFEKKVINIWAQNSIGTKLILNNCDNEGFVYDPVANKCSIIPNWPSNAVGAMWENCPSFRNLFLIWTNAVMASYSFQENTVYGAEVIPLNINTKLPYGFQPLLLNEGEVYCQTLGGVVEKVPLYSHREYTFEEFVHLYPNEDDQGRLLKVLYLVGKWSCVWSICAMSSMRNASIQLAETLIKNLDFTSAIKLFRLLHDASMVLNLNRISKCFDKNEISGHAAVLLGQFGLAQDHFLRSSKPKEALLLWKDLLEWEQALGLAQKIAPEEISTISYEYGSQLEMEGRYGEAHSMYEKAIQAMNNCELAHDVLEVHKLECQRGFIRMTFALGDLTKGMSLLSRISDKPLIKECISLMQSMKQHSEAGSLYEKLEDWDHAAQSYILAKKWVNLSHIMSKISNPQIYLEYARAQETEGNFAAAASWYEKSNDFDNVTRILIEKLGDLDGGAQLVRRTHASESAKKLAAKYLNQRRYAESIEFYIIAGLISEAWALAKEREKLETFAALIKDQASLEMLLEIANHFRKRGNSVESGKFYRHAMVYDEALNMFLSGDAGEEEINLAIETVGEARNDALTNELIDFLMGERDGVPKDAKYVFNLYMGLGKYKEAAKTAVIIAQEEQINGNYSIAHSILFDNYKQLRKTGVPIPAELDHSLMLIHSYTLVKFLVRSENHLLASNMLIRVANNVSKFPSHRVPILTSAVIECYRSGLKTRAVEYASILMRPENRSKLDEKIRRKIEQIVRRPETSEIEANLSKCPSCSSLIPAAELHCPECKNQLPYCIVTGNHMVSSDWSQCSNCQFPALKSAVDELISSFGVCPMCDIRASTNDFPANQEIQNKAGGLVAAE